MPHKHGHAANGNSPTYQCWAAMKHRCNNKNNPQFADYGGRGITVCERWLVFENFLADMGCKPAGMSIERLNNDLGYHPGNCKWATRSEQCLNRRSNRRLRCYSGPRGEKTVAEWSAISGTKHGTISSRIKVQGLGHKEAVFGKAI